MNIREKIKHISKGYEIVIMKEFEEGDPPRKLFVVTTLKRH